MTINAAIAAAIVVGAIGVGAGASYVITKARVAVDCPAPAQGSAPAESRGIPLGSRLPENQGQKF